MMRSNKRFKDLEQPPNMKNEQECQAQCSQNAGIQDVSDLEPKEKAGAAHEP